MAARIVAALVLGVCVLGAAPAVPAFAHDRFRFIGSVVKMDAAKKLLTLKIDKNPDKAYPPEVDIDITAKTRIEQNGRKIAASALKKGAYLVVDALGDDAFTTEAVVIKIVPAPPR